MGVIDTKRLVFTMAAVLVSAAASAVPEDTTAFYQAVTAISPASAATLAGVAKDYMAKCNGGALSVTQLKALVQTEAYSFRMAAKNMGATEADWSPEVRARYAGLVKTLECGDVRAQK